MIVIISDIDSLSFAILSEVQGRRQGSRPSRRKIFFRLPTLVFSLPTLPYVTVAHPAHRTEADLREKA